MLVVSLSSDAPLEAQSYFLSKPDTHDDEHNAIASRPAHSPFQQTLITLFFLPVESVAPTFPSATCDLLTFSDVSTGASFLASEGRSTASETSELEHELEEEAEEMEDVVVSEPVDLTEFELFVMLLIVFI